MYSVFTKTPQAAFFGTYFLVRVGVYAMFCKGCGARLSTLDFEEHERRNQAAAEYPGKIYENPDMCRICLMSDTHHSIQKLETDIRYASIHIEPGYTPDSKDDR